MKIYSFSPFGFEGSLVTVEVDLRKGVPAVDIVGLADNTVRESKERMRSAIRNSGLDFPLERVLVSLSPADQKKEGAGFDLAIALAVLKTKDALVLSKDMTSKEGTQGDTQNIYSAIDAEVTSPFIAEPFSKVLIMGELELSGAVCAVRGVHAAVDTALQSGVKYCIVPLDNVDEAKEVTGAKIFGAQNLQDAYNALYDATLFEEATQDNQAVYTPEGAVLINGIEFPKADPLCDFNQIKNQAPLVRALQIAAAGGHNVLAFGPPGCGKTLSMQHFGELLPLLTPAQAQSVTRIYSLVGALPPGVPLIRVAPFRCPHQTATLEGLTGGGTHCTPGEISLAHNGVLFLDEAAEFKQTVLQTLRIPLETGKISLTRAARSTTYPAQFQLLMAANPCPCGNFGVEGKFCTCSAYQVQKYWQKLSGPLQDRIDIRVKVPSVGQQCVPKSTNELRQDIANAIAIQRKRGKKNSHLIPKEIQEICTMEQKAKDYLQKASLMYDLSARAIASCQKLSRTIADMQKSDIITFEHIKEAIDYRKVAPSF